MSIRPIPTLAKYCVWNAPNGSLAVRIAVPAMDRVCEMAESARRSVRGRGAETGGLLLGARSTVDGTTVLRVDFVEPIACEHRDGPAFRLSEADRGTLEEQVGHLCASKAVIVGTFRSDTRNSDDEDGHAVAEDWRLLDALAPESAVFLLIRTSDAVPMTGRVHARAAKRAVVDSGWAKFPFAGAPFAIESLPAAASAAGRQERPAANRRSNADMAQATQPEGFVQPPAASTHSQRSGSALWFALATLTGAALGFATMYFADRAGKPRPSVSRPAYMRAEADAADVRLVWDGSAKGLEHGATVTVNDGGDVRRFELDASAARSGRLRVSTKTPEAHIALEGPGVHETLVVIR